MDLISSLQVLEIIDECSTIQETVSEQAKRELLEEERRKAVDAMKDRLRQKKRLFPWRIRIINLNRG